MPPTNQVNHPGADGSMDLNLPQPPRQPAQPGPQSGGTITLTQEQFQQMLDKIQGHQEQDYASQFGEEVEQPPVVTVEQVLEQLPDHQTDPKGFRTGLATILAGAREEIVNEAVAINQQRQQQVNVMDEAWAVMQRDYPNLAEHPDLVELATTRERMDLARRGVDITVALSQNLDGVVEQIARRAQTSLNNIRGAGDGEPGEEPDPGILQPGNFTRPQPGKTAEPKPMGLVDQLREIQTKMGIY
jgi:hypothetical protein